MPAPRNGLAEPSKPLERCHARRRAAAPPASLSTCARPAAGAVDDPDPAVLFGVDHKITIRPHGNRDVEVSIIHIVDPLVAAGERVRGGETLVAGGPRQLDFESQVDRFTEAARGAPAPHVHVEMRATDGVAD